MTVSPAATVAVEGTIVTDVAGPGIDFTGSTALTDALTLAVITARPTVTAVSRPVAETETVSGLLLDQVTELSVRTLPAASRTVARNCRVVPARICIPESTGDTSTGDTSTEAGAPVELVPVENVVVSRAANASPSRSRTSCVTMSEYSVFALNGASGTNSAVTCVASSVESTNCTVPLTADCPARSCTDAGFRLAPATGSLKTTTMAALRGTSRLRGGGSVLTTTGLERDVTMARDSKSVIPPASVTRMRIESPTCAPIATGSKPPSRTPLVSAAELPTRRIVAYVPPGTVPAVSETYTMLSAAAGDVGERDAATLPAIATAPSGIGFETIRPEGGGGGGLGPALSLHAANSATPAKNAAEAQAKIRPPTVPSARTATPLSGRPYATDTSRALAHRAPPVLTNPAQ